MMKTKQDKRVSRSEKEAFAKTKSTYKAESWPADMIPYPVRERHFICHAKDILQQTTFYDASSAHPIVGVKQNDALTLYVLGNVLSQDASGEGLIRRAQNLETGAFVIAKEISGHGQAAIFIEPEKTALTRLERLLGYIELSPHDLDKHRGILLMPHYPGKTLFDRLYKKSGGSFSRAALSFTLRKSLFIHLISAVKFIHDKKIAHCDLNPRNCLVDLNSSGDVASVRQLTVIDFGCSKTERHYHRSLSETFGYLAPDADPIYRSSHHLKEIDFNASLACDLFSLGVMLAEVLSNYSFQAYREMMLNKIRENEGHPRPLTRAEIKQGMPDIFINKTHPDYAGIKPLIAIIKTFCSTNPDKRQSLAWAFRKINQSKLHLDLSYLREDMAKKSIKINDDTPPTPRPSRVSNSDSQLNTRRTRQRTNTMPCYSDSAHLLPHSLFSEVKDKIVRNKTESNIPRPKQTRI